jgi:UDP-N-acetylglucosamine 2-epimerase (non-hydrolysing)
MNSKIKIVLIAGARPNFMKIAPLMHEMKKHPEFVPILVHTGQHYDEKMSDLFFNQLGIHEPDINLEVGSASHAVQTARIMERFEKVCLNERPDAVLVVGDVNSTAACVLVASKLNIKTIHYEAGLRSNDRSMPEEINRVVTDAICDIFFTTSVDANENLIKEGKDREKIFMVGNLMIDSLFNNLIKVEQLDVEILDSNGKKHTLGNDLKAGEYGVMTFHRPSNVDDPDKLLKLVNIWGKISEKIPLVFPIHPRTVKNLKEFSIFDRIQSFANLFLIEPAAYLQFINLVKNSRFVLTDSGGIQEETTYLNIPCLTIRPNTERPVTVWEGSNKLIKTKEAICEVDLILQGKGKRGNAPKFWDGKSAKRIVTVLGELFSCDE